MPSDIFTVDLDDFDHKVLAASHTRPVLIDLWAEWCPPCISIAPVLEQVIGEYAGRVQLAKIEVDDGENMKLAGRYQVRGFPTIILFRLGEEQARFSGAQSAGYIRDFIEQHAGF
ncbi:thioredoxin family protein [Thiohalophilus sp.]|uniref:thioredoxin family protein n=1 Tax=Thiohalophilus sp. TaxID=3028392 RepID=UPI002ACECCB6|nr:thioredoxin family protein [Thiohalophilus sp.]MDZ7662148.1 thioredoxin family protein [Thiohalophilus sp.]